MKTPKATPVETAPSNAFVKTFCDLRRGALATEASQILAELVLQVRKTGKKGKLKLEMTFRPSADAIEITAVIEPKIPKHDPKATTLFDTDDGGLQRDDPKQKELFGVVEGGAETEQASQPLAQAVNG